MELGRALQLLRSDDESLQFWGAVLIPSALVRVSVAVINSTANSGGKIYSC